MLAPLLLLASLAAAPTVTSAIESWDGQRLEVAVGLDGPLAAESVHVSRTERGMRLTLAGASLDQAEKLFGEGPAPVRARRTGGGVRVDAPIGRRIACVGEPTLAVTASGLLATQACSLKAGPAEEERRAIEAAVALPSSGELLVPPPPPPLQDPIVAPRDEKKAPAPVAAPVETAAAVAAPPAQALAVLSTLPASEPSRAGQDAKPEAFGLGLGTSDSRPAGSSSTGVAFPLLVVGVLGAVGFLALRRRARIPRVIEVLETASLGPKRSLVVTRVGGRTLLLGSSEAGIALLSTVEEGAAARALASSEGSAAAVATAASADHEAAGSQASLLARLLGRGRPPAPSFADLLAESAEDQDLRRKLEVGLPGRVA